MILRKCRQLRILRPTRGRATEFADSQTGMLRRRLSTRFGSLVSIPPPTVLTCLVLADESRIGVAASCLTCRRIPRGATHASNFGAILFQKVAVRI